MICIFRKRLKINSIKETCTFPDCAFSFCSGEKFNRTEVNPSLICKENVTNIDRKSMSDVLDPFISMTKIPDKRLDTFFSTWVVCETICFRNDSTLIKSKSIWSKISRFSTTRKGRKLFIMKVNLPWIFTVFGFHEIFLKKVLDKDLCCFIDDVFFCSWPYIPEWFYMTWLTTFV